MFCFYRCRRPVQPRFLNIKSKNPVGGRSKPMAVKISRYCQGKKKLLMKNCRTPYVKSILNTCSVAKNQNLRSIK